MKKIIIDVDTGLDDAMAIMYALSQKHVEVLAITCVDGNTDLQNVCRNTLRVLQYCDKSDIPVYKGAGKPLLNKSKRIPGEYRVHGSDGLGGATWDNPVDLSLLQSEHAVQALIRLVKQYPGEITLVTLAPLTNVALALQLDESFGSNLMNMFIMGGNMEGKGNVSISAEFNFHTDPEAAHIVLEEVSCPITIITWENCIDSSLPWEFAESLLSLNSEKAEFFKKTTFAEFNNTEVRVKRYPGFRRCDLYAMMVLFDESVCLEFKEVHASVELQGTYTRGQMVVDWLCRWHDQHNVRLARKLDTEKIKQHLIHLLK